MANLRRCISQNSDNLAAQRAVDGKQDSTIDKLDTKLHDLEDEVAKLVQNLNLVKLRVSQLPELTDLKNSLHEIKKKNDELALAADMQSGRAMTV